MTFSTNSSIRGWFLRESLSTPWTAGHDSALLTSSIKRMVQMYLETIGDPEPKKVYRYLSTIKKTYAPVESLKRWKQKLRKFSQLLHL